MNICLKTYAKQQQAHHETLVLDARLPAWVHTPCHLTCTFNVESAGSYFLVTLNVSGQLTLNCFRCADTYQYDYMNQTTLAVCKTDDVADSLMERYECIVQPDAQINLYEVLTDELYLCVPEKHPDDRPCLLNKGTIN